MRQSLVLIDKKAQGQQLPSLFGHTAIRANGDHALAVGVDSHSHPFHLATNTGFPALPVHEDGRSSNNVPARTPAPGTPVNYATPACPAFPRRCPFGGTCHACPVTVQAKLAINQPGDSCEQEADHVSEQVIRMPESSTPTRITQTGDHDEELRAHRTAASLAASPEAVRRLVWQWGNRRPAAGTVGPDVLHILQAYTGPLPSDLTLRTGSQIDSVLATRRARGLAVGKEIWVGGPQLAPNTGGFASVFVHEAAHVSSGASMSSALPHFDLYEPIGGSWYEAERARQAALEAAETGEGRRRTLDRLASMSHTEARRVAPGIAYRAQDRGDIELAVAAAERLLNAWLASSDYPVTFTAGFGPEDAVDALIERADTALCAGHLELGGKYVAIVMVQLVRAARAAVLRRGPSGEEPELEAVRMMLLPLQRSQEHDVLQRVRRAHELLESHGRAVVARGNQPEIARFEAMAEAVQAAERRAGPRIAEDLGTGGVIEAPAPSGARGRRGRRPVRATAETPPARPEPTPQRPVSRADESIFNSVHPDLEGALVFYSTSPPRTYGNIQSPRYGVAGTLSGAHRLANELFGRRSAVIVEDTHARDPRSQARQIRYLVLALTTRLNPPSTTLGQEGQIQEGQIYGIPNIEMLIRPASPQYFFLAMTSGDWQFFAPPLLSYIRQIHASEKRIQAPSLGMETRREAIFGPINALIAQGETQEAANRLTYVGAAGFALVDTATKTRYVVTMLRAITFQAHEETIVEVFRTVTSQAELRTILHGLHQEGVLRQLHTDLQTAFPSLLITVGQRAGPRSLSAGQVRRLLGELRILNPFPGIEVRADGSVTLNFDVIGEFVAAVEELINTITSAVTGIVDILLEPQAFFEGIYKLVYFVVMADLASKGHPGALRYVSQVIDGIARQIGAATRGLAALQENMPEGVEFVRDLQRSIEWRIIWEVIGLFVGVGEAVALVDAIRGGRAAAAVSDLAAGLVRSGRAVRAAGAAEEAAEAARLAERGVEAAGRRGVEAGEGARRVGRTAEAAEETTEAARRASAAAEEVAPAARPHGPGGIAARAPEMDVPGEIMRIERLDLAEAGAHRVVVSRVGGTAEIWMCTHCGRLLGRIDNALAAVSPAGPTRSLHTRLTRLRERVAEAERGLARGTLTVDDLPAELNQVGAHLRDLSRRHPDVAELVSFGDLPISPEMRRFIRDTARPTTHFPASQYRRHVNGRTNPERRANSVRGNGQYLAELDDGTRVTDAIIEDWERQGLQLAREGHGRVEGGGGTYHCYVDLGFTVGYADGAPTGVMRVEWTSGGHVHSHPRPMSDL